MLARRKTGRYFYVLFLVHGKFYNEKHKRLNQTLLTLSHTSKEKKDGL